MPYNNFGLTPTLLNRGCSSHSKSISKTPKLFKYIGRSGHLKIIYLTDEFKITGDDF